MANESPYRPNEKRFANSDVFVHDLDFASRAFATTDALKGRPRENISWPYFAFVLTLVCTVSACVFIAFHPFLGTLSAIFFMPASIAPPLVAYCLIKLVQERKAHTPAICKARGRLVIASCTFSLLAVALLAYTV